MQGKEYSHFGEIVFHKQPDRVWHGYLDPRQAIPRDHIEKAAEEAGVSTNKIDETVQSLSAHMGWDITIGSEQGIINNEGSEDSEQ
ncbi:hypothetical protein [Candidatus Venteria ishoeyi]|uniref:Uncharacterized protein n=1 Tax=Candidatus Venteria ishoeyi TaxID=1899563 RepID=A0A1H6FE13_9GAMM|nr:hypothetical protein [Candidatus Venteria ishoeyi]MDM8545377.1 hypothetical protein [Candidatus Venteria ishoeyi]SEH07265.1 Uncharacterised protein [Candidatus Venteria ishoeyi]